MAIAAVSIAPVGEGTSVSAYVAEALRVVRAQDRVAFRLDPMFTTLEGELREILERCPGHGGSGLRCRCGARWNGAEDR